MLRWALLVVTLSSRAASAPLEGSDVPAFLSGSVEQQPATQCARDDADLEWFYSARRPHPAACELTARSRKLTQRLGQATSFQKDMSAWRSSSSRRPLLNGADLSELIERAERQWPDPEDNRPDSCKRVRASCNARPAVARPGEAAAKESCRRS